LFVFVESHTTQMPLNRKGCGGSVGGGLTKAQLKSKKAVAARLNNREERSLREKTLPKGPHTTCCLILRQNRNVMLVHFR
jgi:hypothetical protein